MRYKVTVPGRGPGAQFVTPHGHVAIDANGYATLNEAQRKHLERSYGATCEPVIDGDVVLTEAAVVEPTAGAIAARENIAANRAAAEQAQHESSTLPPRAPRKRK